MISPALEFEARGRQFLYSDQGYNWRKVVRWEVVAEPEPTGLTMIISDRRPTHPRVRAALQIAGGESEGETLGLGCASESDFAESVAVLVRLRDEVNACLAALRAGADVARKAAGPDGWGAEPEPEEAS